MSGLIIRHCLPSEVDKMGKKNNQISEDKEDIHYPNIPLNENGFSNSILAINKNCQLNKEEKAKLLEYFVVSPINLIEKSRKAYDLKANKDIDFSNKGLRKALSNIYDFDNNEVFKLLKPDNTTNTIAEWYMNGTFPSDQIISLERMCIKNSYGNSKVLAMIGFIRNCICHGNFEIYIIGKKKYIVLEDNTGSFIRGRGCIMLSKLFKFIETILNYNVE